LYGAPPAYFFRSLTHREQSYPCLLPGYDTHTIVAHLDVEAFFHNAKTHLADGCMRMANHIGQGFLYNTIGRYFEGGW
jgi:hypothetical protein